MPKAGAFEVCYIELEICGRWIALAGVLHWGPVPM